MITDVGDVITDVPELPPEDTNEDLHTAALESVPEEEGEEDADLPSFEVEEFPIALTAVWA